MKTKLYIVTCLIILLAGCKKDPLDTIVSKNGVSYKQSLGNWQAYKRSVNNNYIYTVTTASWTGFSTETKITVHNGVVTARNYALYQMINSSRVALNSYSEISTTLNTHTEGAQTLTLDDIYSKAANDWLKADTNTNTIYFEVDANGLLSSAGYVPKNCADDCFVGINISSIVGV